jgi:hypothetical protein
VRTPTRAPDRRGDSSERGGSSERRERSFERRDSGSGNRRGARWDPTYASVGILSFEEMSVGVSKFALYTVAVVRNDGMAWAVRKRYSEFDELHKQLKRASGAVMTTLRERAGLRLPRKGLLVVGKADLEARREQLGKFLARLCNTQMLMQEGTESAALIRKFLEDPAKVRGRDCALVLRVLM